MKTSTEIMGIIGTIIVGLIIFQGCAALKERQRIREIHKDIYDMVVFGIKNGASCEYICLGIRGYMATKGIKIP